MGKKSKKRALTDQALAAESKRQKTGNCADQCMTNRNQGPEEMQAPRVNFSQTIQVREDEPWIPNTNRSQVRYSAFSGIFSLIPEENPVLIEYETDTPISVLCRVDITYDLNLTWTFNVVDDMWQCNIFYDQNCVSWSCRPQVELVAEEAAREALVYMKKYCYTITVSENRHETAVYRADIVKETDSVVSNYSEIVRKVEGHGGITEFAYQDRIREQTVKLMESGRISSFDRDCWRILNRHFGNTLSDLVFRCFQDEEILLLESFARKLGCSCERYFLDGHHVMIVSHNHGTRGMIDILKRSGGVSGKYTLINPYVTIH